MILESNPYRLSRSFRNNNDPVWESFPGLEYSHGSAACNACYYPRRQYRPRTKSLSFNLNSYEPCPFLSVEDDILEKRFGTDRRLMTMLTYSSVQVRCFDTLIQA